MTDLVLHHYPNSPWAEVVRLALGLKGARYYAVVIPSVSPKPELTALTGGYERTPVLQIGADVYCDTLAICRALEERVDGPSLYPQPLGRAGLSIALSAALAFGSAVGAALAPIADQVPDAFWQDRGVRFGLKKERLLAGAPHLEAQFAASIAIIQSILADGRRFVGGDAPGHADLALYMLVWFQRMRGLTPASFGETVGGWAKRVAAIGHGTPDDWAAEQAIALAAESEPSGSYVVEEGWSVGEAVRVKTDTPDPAVVTGALIGLDATRIVVERTDARAGTVHVHLPRLGQVLMRG